MTNIRQEVAVSLSGVLTIGKEVVIGAFYMGQNSFSERITRGEKEDIIVYRLYKENLDNTKRGGLVGEIYISKRFVPSEWKTYDRELKKAEK